MLSNISMNLFACMLACVYVCMRANLREYLRVFSFVCTCMDACTVSLWSADNSFKKFTLRTVVKAAI